MIRKLFRWVFSAELIRLEREVSIAAKNNASFIKYKRNLEDLLNNIDVTVDVEYGHGYAKSWAVVSIQGEKTDFIKFFDLGRTDMLNLRDYLMKFDRNIKTDATPEQSMLLKINSKNCKKL